MARSLSTKHRIDVGPYVFILPSLIVITVFLLVPIFRASVLSVTNSKLLVPGKANFVGLANYRAFFLNSSFSNVIIATLAYVTGGVGLTYILGLFTAAVVNVPFKAKGLVRTLLILPWVVPDVVLVIIWKWMLTSRYGVVNFFLYGIGLVGIDFSWLSSPTFAIFAILFATVWKQYPLGLLILLAGMQSIPSEQYEAANVDGASFFQRFFYITLPGLRYVTTVLILLLVIWHFGNFVIIWLMTRGGPQIVLQPSPSLRT